MAKTVFPNYITDETAKAKFAPKNNPVFGGNISMGRATTKGVGSLSTATGSNVTASGFASHAEGTDTEATKAGAHAEGAQSHANGEESHAEGYKTVASGNYSHAEGESTKAAGNSSHASGKGTEVNSEATFVFGKYNRYESFSPTSVPPSGWACEVGMLVKYNGTVYECAIAHRFSTAEEEFGGGYNFWVPYVSKYVEVVGNGTSSTQRSDARTLDWDGNEWLAGSLTLGSTTLTEAKLQQLLALLS